MMQYSSISVMQYSVIYLLWYRDECQGAVACILRLSTDLMAAQPSGGTRHVWQLGHSISFRCA